MSKEATEAGTKKKSNGGVILLVSLIAIGLVVGAIYLFSKGSETKNATTTTTSNSSNGGLSGLLSGLNLNGLHILG